MPGLTKLHSVARMLWYFYSILCILFIAILVVDLLLIWGVGFSGGVTIYVNNFGEGFGEQLEFLSLVPWITITLLRTMEDAAQPSKKKIRLTTTEWAAFKKWLVESRGSPDSSKRAAQEHKAGEH